MEKKNVLLRNLSTLIRNITNVYSTEFIWQDVALTEEFQLAYESYLRSSNYTVTFFESTAVITTSQSKYIFVPNQWFAIASYVIDVYEELYKYKEYFRIIADYRSEKLDAYAKKLRDYPTDIDKTYFIDAANVVLKSDCNTQEMLDDAVDKLWKFVTDYSWWSGQKTIDRGDFHVSVILNMLNLVNASQGYVADIVSAYANDRHLRNLVRNLDLFTVDFARNIVDESELTPDDEHLGSTDENSEKVEAVIPVSIDRAKIKITGNDIKEIKYKK
jgi:hypothetical protein